MQSRDVRLVISRRQDVARLERRVSKRDTGRGLAPCAPPHGRTCSTDAAQLDPAAAQRHHLLTDLKHGHHVGQSRAGRRRDPDARMVCAAPGVQRLQHLHIICNVQRKTLARKWQAVSGGNGEHRQGVASGRKPLPGTRRGGGVEPPHSVRRSASSRINRYVDGRTHARTLICTYVCVIDLITHPALDAKRHSEGGRLGGRANPLRP